MRIEVKEARFGYEWHKPLFKNLSFKVEKGEILTILGPNGAGKTTLLKCMTGMLKWHEGHTFLNDQRLDILKSTDIWRQIAYVPQNHNLVFGYSVLDIVAMGRCPHLEWYSLPGERDMDIACQALENVGISHLSARSFSELSGGERQMVMIARALASQPGILILDEPESHLDFKNQLIILDLLEKISHDRGISCIINTHYPEHALRIADKTLIIGRQCCHIFGLTEDIVSEENLKLFFDVNTRVLSFFDRGISRKTVVAISV